LLIPDFRLGRFVTGVADLAVAFVPLAPAFTGLATSAATVAASVVKISIFFIKAPSGIGTVRVKTPGDSRPRRSVAQARLS
jgi:hypothetical protein